MPELPEVETVCRLFRSVLEGRAIVEAEVVPDEIVLIGVPHEAFHEALVGSRVTGVGRKGKFWWIEMDRTPHLCGHLGMAGWVREPGVEAARLREHGEAPLDDETGRPRFLKLRLTSDQGRSVVMTDHRRMAELWLCDDPLRHPRIERLGPDARDEAPTPAQWREMLAKRKAPIKALLLDQHLVSGIGNWIADEMLYQAGIAPSRPANSLGMEELEKMCQVLKEILEVAIEAEVESDRYPETWLFHTRWGGNRGADTFLGRALRRDMIGGRTTAWVPEVQR